MYIRFYLPSLFFVASLLLYATHSIAEEHTMGYKIDSRYYPIRITAGIANHTYLEAFDDTGERHAWGAFGGSTSGKVLADTTSECGKQENCIDISTVNYMMTEKPCFFKGAYNGFTGVGVCWNMVNRGLYYTGKTVHKIPHYWVIEKTYGTYGHSRWYPQYDFSKCLNSVEQKYPWQGHHYRNTPDTLEMHLYKRHFDAEKPENGQDDFFEYLQDLVRLSFLRTNIRINASTQDAVLAIHKKTYQSFQELTETYANSNEDPEELMSKFFNETLDKYKLVLTDEEYEALFNAKKSDVFVLPPMHTNNPAISQ